MKKKNRMKYFRNISVVIVTLVLFLDLFFLLSPDSEYSEVENRNLQQMPELTASSFSSGKFENHFEDYVSDQFPLRTSWIRLKSAVEQLMGKTESNHVYLAQDGYLIQNFTAPNEDTYAATISAINDFAARYPSVTKTMLLAPTAVTVLSDKLPTSAESEGETLFIDRVENDLSDSGIVFTDVRNVFDAVKDKTQLYYRTDHHWTTHGAYIAYQVLARQMDLDGVDRSYSANLISDSFSGTLTASSGCRMNETDDLYAYVLNTEDFSYSVTYYEEGEVRSSFWQTSQLSTRDQYTVFFGGNHPDIRIRTSQETGRTMLVLKDSYANCFLPFLIPDYDQIIVIDPRYYTGDLDLLMESEHVSEVLFLYNASTFATDTALKRELI